MMMATIKKIVLIVSTIVTLILCGLYIAYPVTKQDLLNKQFELMKINGRSVSNAAYVLSFFTDQNDQNTHLFVGFTACNKLSGQAILKWGKLKVPELLSDTAYCDHLLLTSEETEIIRMLTQGATIRYNKVSQLLQLSDFSHSITFRWSN